MDMTLEERVRRLEDREAIRDLVARYGIAVDDRDLDTVREMFTDDGVFRHGDGAVVNHGREEVVAFYTERLGAYGPTYHYPHSHQIEPDGPDTAHGIVTAHAELALADGGETIVVGLRYYDRYRRVDGAWRFAERSIRTLYFMPLSDLPTQLSAPNRKRWPGPAVPSELPDSQPTWHAFRARLGHEVPGV